MRGLRSTLALVVVLAGLGAYIYFVESKRPAASEADAIKPKALDIKPEQIEQFIVKSASGETTTVTKVAGSWQITAPVTAKADDAQLSSMTQSVGGLEIQRIVDQTPADLKQYGLEPPHVDVTVKASADKDAKRLLIGEKTVTGGDVFAKLGSEPKVFLISATLDAAFNKGTFDLRDKTVLKIDREAIDFVEVVSARQTVRLTRSGTDWDMKQPLQTRGDNGVVGDVLTKVLALQMKSVVVSDAKDLAAYGLDRPAYTVTMGLGSARSTLHVGANADESTVYARDVSRPVIFTIDRSLIDDLKKDPSEFRRKDVFDFETMDATGLEITRDRQTKIYTKVNATAPAAPATWREVSPNAGDMDAAKMETALSKLAYLRAVSFVDPKKTKTGLEVLTYSVLVKYDGGKGGKKEDRVTLGKLGAAPFAARAGWGDLGTLDSTAYGLLVDALNDLNPKPRETPGRGDKTRQE